MGNNVSYQSTGYRLTDDRKPASKNPATSPTSTSNNVVRQFYQALKATKLPDEPPSSSSDQIITVQIRGEKGKQCRRRFDTTTSQIGDLFVLAVQEQVVPPEYESSNNDSNISSGFRLVTRFP